jgi:hypothetical protein
MTDIFLSYASADCDWAQRLATSRPTARQLERY